MHQPIGSTPPSRQIRSAHSCALLPTTLLLTLVLSSCGGSDPKAATKENFTQAINAWQTAHPERTSVCEDINVGISDGDKVISSAFMPKNSDWYTQLDSLRRLGYLTLADTTDSLGLPSTKVGMTPKYLQVFGPPGEKVIKTVCVGKSSLDHIDDFTEPSEVMGFRVSQVEATDKQTVTADLPWMKDVALVKLVQYVPPAATKKVVYIMVLKDSGWAVDNVQ